MSKETQEKYLDIQLLLDGLKRNPPLSPSGSCTLLQQDAWIKLNEFIVEKIYWSKKFKASRGLIENHPEVKGFLHDAVQDTILKVFEKVHQQGSEGAFTWLRRLFKNALTDKARREGLLRSDPFNNKQIQHTIRDAFTFEETLEDPDHPFTLAVYPLLKPAKPRTSHDETEADLEAPLALLSNEERYQLETLVLDGVEPSRSLMKKIIWP